MKNKAWKVVWNEDTFGTYLYGSKIWFHSREDIEFENELMPPGTVIKEWYSKVNYQMMRTEPSLPIIDGESSYHIQVNMSDFESYLITSGSKDQLHSVLSAKIYYKKKWLWFYRLDHTEPFLLEFQTNNLSRLLQYA